MLCFTKKPISQRGFRMLLTVASPQSRRGRELQLALNDNPAAKPYLPQQAMFQPRQSAVMSTATTSSADSRAHPGARRVSMSAHRFTGAIIAKLGDTAALCVQLSQLKRWQA
jgi:hypothetical protein